MDFAQSLILSLSILGVSKIVNSQTCEKLSPCKCREGGFTFDLSPLNADINPRFSIVAQSGGRNYTWTFQPCAPLTVCGSAGTTAAACQIGSSASDSYNLGTSDSAAFNGSIFANTLELQFSRGADDRRTTIKMVCKREGLPELQFEVENPVKTYRFNLLSSYACASQPTPGPSSPSKGISPGSVLVILFFVFLFVYFVAGMLFMKFARGAIGTEVIPNYGFWSSLPGLIKDGVTFTCSGCKADTSYAKI